ncbi:MAG: hypothetical protein KJO54_10325, partial [Gammaproteobacteria bacterium]|nr:hypothetical protein [Gammaproteobacteria bacterium]
MKYGRVLTLLAALLVVNTGLAAGGKQLAGGNSQVVGTAQPYSIQPDLKTSRRQGEDRVWSQTVLLPGASFIKIHLVNV